MSECEAQKTIGIDGLIGFGEYLAELADASSPHYTFEMPDGTGRLRECSLEDVCDRFKEFCGGKTDIFRVSIGYVDSQHGTMGCADRTFTRRQQ
jgi:hypothetical protein